MNRKELVGLFRESWRGWQAESVPIRAAALTFFIILPLPSLLLIVVNIFSVFYGQAAALQILVTQISTVAGPAVAELFRELLSSAMSPFSSLWTAVVIVAFSLGGAIGAFAVLRDTMDTIWGYKASRPRSWATRIKESIGPFVLISSLGLIVIASTPIATLLFDAVQRLSISALTFVSLSLAQILFSFFVSMLLFAIIYKSIPLPTVHWRDVTLPSVVAGIAFTVTNYVIGAYIATFPVTTIIGTAGSLFIILLWIFILNQIVLFGAELSKVYATTVGTHARRHVHIMVGQTQEQILTH